MSFRLILQPAVAILLALRAGMRDAREGRPPFLWAVLSDQSRRRELMRHGWKDVGNVFLIALVLDSIYQLAFCKVVAGGVKIGEIGSFRPRSAPAQLDCGACDHARDRRVPQARPGRLGPIR